VRKEERNREKRYKQKKIKKEKEANKEKFAQWRVRNLQVIGRVTTTLSQTVDSEFDLCNVKHF
jgi:hypothetical protein